MRAENMSPKKILVTGFNWFERFDNNPSERLVEYINSQNYNTSSLEILARTLPTAYRGSETQISNLISVFKPHIVLSFGLGFNKEIVTIEQTAVNLDDASYPGGCVADNCGEKRSGIPIISDGPDIYTTMLPVENIAKRLKNNNIPYALSNDAGQFVCNHIFYYTSHLSKTTNNTFINGFFHLPPLEKDINRWGLQCPGCRFEQIASAFNTIVDCLGSTDADLASICIENTSTKVIV